MAGVWIGLAAVVVVLLGAALCSDLRDRGNGGVRKVRMPAWAGRRARGVLRMSPIDWGAADDRPKAPREEWDERRE